ncbi:MAG: response regulator [Anaerolineae bacterium]|nr:response regulator [Anaerolineae bacterium]
MVSEIPRVERPILLVEDNPMDVELTLDALREARLRTAVHVARSGGEALDYLFGRQQYSDRKAYPLPSLVLLDLHLPGIDGYECLRQIKAAPILKRLPVVVFTSSRDDSDVVKSYDRGANSYLVKPASATERLEIARQIHRYWLSLNLGPPLFATDQT